MRFAAVIVAAGSGQRMGTETPKQFLELKGKPILLHSIEKFWAAIPGIRIVVVLSEHQLPFWHQLCFRFPPLKLIQTTFGGSQRFHSVRNGLTWLDEIDVVAIHDAVRPLVSLELIRTLFVQAQQHGCAIPAVSVIDSLRMHAGTHWEVLDRNKVKAVQTPQVFSFSLLKAAYEHTPFHDGITDDASVWEQAGNKLHVVSGEYTNIKITHPADLKYAEYLMQ